MRASGLTSPRCFACNATEERPGCGRSRGMGFQIRSFLANHPMDGFLSFSLSFFPSISPYPSIHPTNSSIYKHTNQRHCLERLTLNVSAPIHCTVEEAVIRCCTDLNKQNLHAGTSSHTEKWLWGR